MGDPDWSVAVFIKIPEVVDAVVSGFEPAIITLFPELALAVVIDEVVVAEEVETGDVSAEVVSDGFESALWSSALVSLGSHRSRSRLVCPPSLKRQQWRTSFHLVSISRDQVNKCPSTSSWCCETLLADRR